MQRELVSVGAVQADAVVPVCAVTTCLQAHAFGYIAAAISTLTGSQDLQLTACCLQAYATASWLLVALIGRSLGLVYRGVRQSVMPRSQRQRRQSQQQQQQRPDMAW